MNENIGIECYCHAIFHSEVPSHFVRYILPTMVAIQQCTLMSPFIVINRSSTPLYRRLEEFINHSLKGCGTTWFSERNRI